ncbi:class I adenylate-forming enzyme family protein [Sphingobium algorifonticola]|uniref:Long-chain fatty acid--CoA ligase n=1 Tax=Sphingobium algorifonticola TaxID=2008318 RepID=A0A437J8W9_9SPHN|nr:AMP-binding protein [Sphingobium algorifonticola]RVT41938.1 long-chain fatty acid--CoA ligase [Sphingobium algorifonticola]
MLKNLFDKAVNIRWRFDMFVNTSSIIDFTLRRDSESVAFIEDAGVDGAGMEGTSRMTYAAFDTFTSRLAAVLTSRGLRPGDRCAICLPTSIAYAAALFAAWKAGLIVVPIGLLLSESEVANILSRSNAKMLIHAEQHPDHLKECFASLSNGIAYEDLAGKANVLDEPTHRSIVNGPDIALILYTSGTTGAPKGVVLSHNGLVYSAMIAANALDMSARDVITTPLPLSHVFGLVAGLLAGLMSGASVNLIARFQPTDCLSALHSHGTTIFFGVPTMFGALIAAAGGVAIGPHLRIASSGGAPLSRALSDRFHSMTGIRIIEGYGMTETSGVIAIAQPGDEDAAGTVGKPVPFMQWKIRPATDLSDSNDKGELWVKGPGVMLGYDDDKDATEAVMDDGWLRTGDIVCVDDQGRLVIVDRLKDVILRGGYNVYPAEVEAALMEHEDIVSAAVVGRADDDLGEEVTAYVVLQSRSTATPESLIAWSRNRLAKYKYPRSIHLVDQLPVSPTGKILKKFLK